MNSKTCHSLLLLHKLISNAPFFVEVKRAEQALEAPEIKEKLVLLQSLNAEQNERIRRHLDDSDLIARISEYLLSLNAIPEIATYQEKYRLANQYLLSLKDRLMSGIEVHDDSR